MEWFCNELDNHPFLSWTESENIFVDKVALAQHYGIHTECLDMSESLEVSAFFACCQFDEKSGSYIPCTSGRGILYHAVEPLKDAFDSAHGADSP